MGSSRDPFVASLLPSLAPPCETPARRDARILAENLAKQVDDAIDEQLRVRHAELKKSSAVSHCGLHMFIDVLLALIWRISGPNSVAPAHALGSVPSLPFQSMCCRIFGTVS
jgi:hypothetical protein